MIIYKAQCKTTGKVYIGQTRQSLAARRYQHEREAVTLNLNTKWMNALNKYGKDNFEWSVLEECKSLDELNSREVYWIHQYDSINSGFNTLIGGMSNPMDNEISARKHLAKVQSAEFRLNHSIKMKQVVSENGFSEEHRRKISAKLANNKNFQGKNHSAKWGEERSARTLGANHPMYGRKHSEETKQKIREASLSRKSGAKKIVAVSQSGTLEFKSLSEAERWLRANSEYTKATEQTIRKSARSGTPAYGYQWNYSVE